MDPRVVVFWTAEEVPGWPLPDVPGWIWEETRQGGRLRQGWAPPGTKLTENGAAVPPDVWARRYVEGARRHWQPEDAEPLLTPDKVASRYRILSIMPRLQRGDVILVPHMPSRDEFTIARVSDGYQFIDNHYAQVHPDLGHTIRIDLASIATWGYGRCEESRRIPAKFQHYRSAVNLVRNAEYRRLILKLTP